MLQTVISYVANAYFYISNIIFRCCDAPTERPIENFLIGRQGAGRQGASSADCRFIS